MEGGVHLPVSVWAVGLWPGGGRGPLVGGEFGFGFLLENLGGDGGGGEEGSERGQRLGVKNTVTLGRVLHGGWFLFVVF